MDQRTGYLLKRLQLALRAAMDRALASEELTTPQYSVLSALDREPGLSNAELARRSFVTPQTMIRIVRHLEGAGLLTREAHPSHGRMRITHLTSEGKERVRRSHALVSEVEERMLAPLDEEERLALNGHLSRCLSVMDEKG